MTIVKFGKRRVDLDALSLSDTEEFLMEVFKIVADIEEQLEYPLILESSSKKSFDVSGATYALRQYKVCIPVIERAIADKRKQEHIEKHLAQGQRAGQAAAERKHDKQKVIAELFVQVAWERMNEPLFDAFMAEAKKRRKGER